MMVNSVLQALQATLSILQTTLMNDLRNIDSDLPTLRNENFANILLYGNQINIKSNNFNAGNTIY